MTTTSWYTLHHINGVEHDDRQCFTDHYRGYGLVWNGIGCVVYTPDHKCLKQDNQYVVFSDEQAARAYIELQ